MGLVRASDDSCNNAAKRPQAHDAPETALERIRFTVTGTQGPQAPSGYLTAKGKALFRNGGHGIPAGADVR